LCGAALAFAAFLLVLTTNLPTVLWSVAALMVTLIYPYTKRFFSMPQAVLGVAFSFGIPMAFSAVLGEVPARPGHCCWATCSGCWPTTPSTPWSTATTT
jgi:4-hydroxybenzoate polyprenyltransferase